jgi:hypothetical protein
MPKGTTHWQEVQRSSLMRPMKLLRVYLIKGNLVMPRSYQLTKPAAMP